MFTTDVVCTRSLRLIYIALHNISDLDDCSNLLHCDVSSRKQSHKYSIINFYKQFVFHIFGHFINKGRYNFVFGQLQSSDLRINVTNFNYFSSSYWNVTVPWINKIFQHRKELKVKGVFKNVLLHLWKCVRFQWMVKCVTRSGVALYNFPSSTATSSIDLSQFPHFPLSSLFKSLLQTLSANTKVLLQWSTVKYYSAETLVKYYKKIILHFVILFRVANIFKV